MPPVATEYLVNFHPAPVGWYVWYKLMTLPEIKGTSNLLRRPVIGWGIHITRTTISASIPGPGYIDVITRICAFVRERNQCYLIECDKFDTDYDMIGFEFPGMSEADRNQMFVEGELKTTRLSKS